MSREEQNELIAELHRDIASWKREMACLKAKARRMGRRMQLHGEHLMWAADGKTGTYGYDTPLPTADEVRETIEGIASLNSRIAQGQRDLEAMV